MANKILVARGTKARIEEIKSTLTVNELVYSTDTGELGVKKANGNIEYFMNATDINAIVDDKDTIKEQNNNTDIKFWTGTQAQYDAIGTKDANTLYFIEEE